MDAGLSAAPTASRSRNAPSPFWLPAVGALAAALAAAVGVATGDAFDRVPLAHYGLQLIIGFTVGGAGLAAVWWFAVRGRARQRLLPYTVAWAIGWLAGLAASDGLTPFLHAAIDHPVSGGTVEQAYWEARVSDVNGYYRALREAFRPVRSLRPSTPAGMAAARAIMLRAHQALAGASARNTGQLELRRQQLVALGHNAFERRALVVNFNERVATGEAEIAQLYRLEAMRLDGLDAELTAIEHRRDTARPTGDGVPTGYSSLASAQWTVESSSAAAEQQIVQINALLSVVRASPTEAGRGWIEIDQGGGAGF